MPSKAVFSVDVEQDAPPYLKTWRGIEEGLPRLLKMLDELGIRATFFVTGECCERFPDKIAEIARNHEVGCHGYLHERLDLLPFDEQFRRLKLATEIIEKTIEKRPVGFRSPNFRCNKHTYRALVKLGYFYDSSVPVYGLGQRPETSGLIEIMNTMPSSILRLPSVVSLPIVQLGLRVFRPLVLDFHPWELVEMKNVRWDCRFATGKVAEARLRKVLTNMLRIGVKFRTMEEVAKELRNRNIYKSKNITPIGGAEEWLAL
ncbi:MAG: polysaccharide deacetylase family protein [Candidatus Hadarchaeales archaeon]